MSKLVIDASALLAVLLGEEPAKEIEKLIPSSVISSVNFSEVVAKLTDIDMPENKIREILESLPIEVYSFNKKQAYIAGLLRPLTKSKGLSFGDRACLSLGMLLKAPVVTMDRVWKNLNIGIEIRVLR
jgi:PIN domain nuclease of toxin-antitoxin system